MHNNLAKAGLLVLAIITIFIIGWEGYLRSKGHPVTYDDGNALWADKRANIYKPADKATVFIGSSRIKFDLDIPTWKVLTGEDAVQLAMQGNSPLPILHDLAEDKDFKGKLVVDVTEGLFFSTSPYNTTEPKDRITYFHKRTPAQRAGFEVNHVLESNFVFLDKDYFSLNAYLNGLKIPSRPDVYPGPDFPLEFDGCQFDRQSKMTPEFVADTNLHNKVTAIWMAFGKRSKDKPVMGKALDSIMLSIKTDVDKIKNRGGQVVFVRTPSSGPYWQIEQMGFPRPQYWDKLLLVTGCKGIHFKDTPAIANFVCPEWSHLSPADAVVFTKTFVPLLEGIGWQFPSKAASKTSIAYNTKN